MWKHSPSSATSCFFFGRTSNQASGSSDSFNSVLPSPESWPLAHYIRHPAYMLAMVLYSSLCSPTSTTSLRRPNTGKRCLHAALVIPTAVATRHRCMALLPVKEAPHARLPTSDATKVGIFASLSTAVEFSCMNRSSLLSNRAVRGQTDEDRVTRPGTSGEIPRPKAYAYPRYYPSSQWRSSGGRPRQMPVSTSG